MKISILSIITIISLLYGCGTQKLKSDEYISVGRGGKALLTTSNRGALSPLGMLFDKWFGEPSYREEIDIIKIDDKEIHTDMFVDNIDVLIDPGIRSVKVECHLFYKDKNKVSKHDTTYIKMNFIGGYKYFVKIKSFDGYSCSAEIIENEKYNKSLNRNGAKDAPPG